MMCLGGLREGLNRWDAYYAADCCAGDGNISSNPLVTERLPGISGKDQPEDLGLIGAPQGEGSVEALSERPTATGAGQTSAGNPKALR